MSPLVLSLFWGCVIAAPFACVTWWLGREHTRQLAHYENRLHALSRDCALKQEIIDRRARADEAAWARECERAWGAGGQCGKGRGRRARGGEGRCGVITEDIFTVTPGLAAREGAADPSLREAFLDMAAVRSFAQSVEVIKAALLQAITEQAEAQRVEMTQAVREAVALEVSDLLNAQEARPPAPPPAPRGKDHGPHMLDRKEAMELMRINCGKTFLATVRRLGIPRIKMNKRKYLYPRAEIIACLEENRVGLSRSRFARSRCQLL